MCYSYNHDQDRFRSDSLTIKIRTDSDLIALPSRLEQIQIWQPYHQDQERFRADSIAIKITAIPIIINIVFICSLLILFQQDAVLRMECILPCSTVTCFFFLNLRLSASASQHCRTYHCHTHHCLRRSLSYSPLPEMINERCHTHLCEERSMSTSIHATTCDDQ